MTPRGTSPIVPVADPQASIRFYTETLGFELVFHNTDHGYALFRHDQALVAIIQATDDAALHATSHHISAQIWVDNVDDLWGKLAPKLNGLPSGRVHAPFDRVYGVREFHVKDPDGFLMFFTQA